MTKHLNRAGLVLLRAVFVVDRSHSDYATARRPGVFQGCLGVCCHLFLSNPLTFITADESCVKCINKDLACAKQKGVDIVL